MVGAFGLVATGDVVAMLFIFVFLAFLLFLRPQLSSVYSDSCTSSHHTSSIVSYQLYFCYTLTFANSAVCSSSVTVIGTSSSFETVLQTHLMPVPPFQ